MFSPLLAPTGLFAMVFTAHLLRAETRPLFSIQDLVIGRTFLFAPPVRLIFFLRGGQRNGADAYWIAEAWCLRRMRETGFYSISEFFLFGLAAACRLALCDFFFLLLVFLPRESCAERPLLLPLPL